MTNSSQVSTMTPPKPLNPSGLHPVGRAVLVQAYEPEISAGVIHIPSTVRERTMMVETRAIVLEIGSECWKTESQPRAWVGDKILISKYCGAILTGPQDGLQYRMVNDEDVFARIEE